MKKPPSNQSATDQRKRDKATIDHLVDEVYEEKPDDRDPQSPTTGSGLPVEEQVRKEWDPEKSGGLPTF